MKKTNMKIMSEQEFSIYYKQRLPTGTSWWWSGIENTFENHIQTNNIVTSKYVCTKIPFTQTE